MKTPMTMNFQGPIRGSVLRRLLPWLALFVLGVAAAWIFLLPAVAARYVRSRTGFDVQIQKLAINPFTATVALRGLVVTNPPTFPLKDFADVREFRVNARLASLFSKRLVVDDAVVNVANVTIVRDQRGLINAKVFQEGLTGAAENRPPKPPGEAKKREFLIKHLQLRFDRLVVADYSKARPTVREYGVNLDHTYENVTSVGQLIVPLGATFATLTHAVGDLLPGVGKALTTADEVFKQTGKTTGEAVKGIFDALEKSLKK